MKKVISILFIGVFVALSPVISLAVSGLEDSNGANSESAQAEEVDEASDGSTSTSNSTSTQNGNYNFSEDSTIRESIRNQVMENNPEVGEMTREQVRELAREEAALQVADKIQTSKPDYPPSNLESKSRKSLTEDACEDIIVLSAMISDEKLGSKLEISAKTFLLSEDKINAAIDNADERSAFAKFFIGPNYGELSTVKVQIEQNQVRIQEMNQVYAQIENEADQTELKTAIQTLEAQNTALQEQLEDEEARFSLFGWLARWIGGY